MCSVSEFLLSLMVDLDLLVVNAIHVLCMVESSCYLVNVNNLFELLFSRDWYKFGHKNVFLPLPVSITMIK